MNNSFGPWLARQLQRRELSQSDLARRLGTRASTVGNWVHGRRVPDIESCWALADALNLTPAAVMQAAGHPVEVEVMNDDEDRLLALWRKLTPEGQEDVMQFVEFRRERERHA